MLPSLEGLGVGFEYGIIDTQPLPRGENIEHDQTL